MSLLVCILISTTLSLSAARPAQAAGLAIRIGLAWDRWAVECTGLPARGLVPLANSDSLWPDLAPSVVNVPAADSGTYRVGTAVPITAVVGAEAELLVQAVAASAGRWARFAGTAAEQQLPVVSPIVLKQGPVWYYLPSGDLALASPDAVQEAFRNAGWPGFATLRPMAPGRPGGQPVSLGAVAQEGSLGGLIYQALSPVNFVPPADAVRVQHVGRPYRGRLELLNAGAAELLSVVNHVDIEDYLLGVVPSEMPASWPLEALKAQAVAARTYTVSNLRKHAASGFDLCFDIHCQAYGGVFVEHASTSTAVRATASIVATHGGRLINAVYHAHAGGATDSSQVVWGSAEPYLVGTSRTFEQSYYWTATNTRLEVEAVIRATLDTIPEGLMPVLQLVPRSFTSGGRATRVDILGSGVVSQITANRLRSALGTYRLRSGNFTAAPVWVASVWETWSGHGALAAALPVITWAPGSRGSGVLVWQQDDAPASTTGPAGPAGREVTLSAGWLEPAFQVFSGEGFGHGVGMSQWGAREMAALGHNYAAILTNFYRGIVLTPNYGR